MGLFTGNRGYLGLDYESDVVTTNESYTHEFGIGQMLVDNAKNDMAIFEALIQDDFTEVASIQEGVSYINEASFGGFIDKIKAFLIKCWEKIKGVIKSFLIKFVAMFIKDNAELVKKYEKDIDSKNLSKMKYKWRNPNAKFLEESKGVNSLNGKTELDKTNNVSLLKKIEEYTDSEKFVDDCYESLLGKQTTEADFRSDFEESCFDDQSEEEGLSSAVMSTIKSYLKDAAKTKKDIDNLQKNIDKHFKEALKNLENAKNSEGITEQYKTFLNIKYKRISIAEKCLGNYVSAKLAMHKIMLAQCRRVFVQAAAYRPVKEDAILMNAIGEAAELGYDVL